jgi:hypothetical protein
MRKLFFVALLVSFLGGFALAQETEKSPMYYKGVDAGMSPEEVVKVLGEPNRTTDQKEKLQYYYKLDDGSSFSIFFHKKKWLSSIVITIRPAVHFKELGLTEEGGQGFKAIEFDYGAKIWRKTIDTEKFGKITITYAAKPGDKGFIQIDTKSLRVVDPTIFEK